MTISLIVTTYNRPDALRLVLDSISRQSRLPDEVVVADDGSGDETRRLLENTAAGFPVPLRHVWQEDKGFRAGTARNKAIAAASGEYIVQIDGDMVLHPCFVADHAAVARRGAFVLGSRVRLNEEWTRRYCRSGRFPSISIFSRAIYKGREKAIRLPRFIGNRTSRTITAGAARTTISADGSRHRDLTVSNCSESDWPITCGTARKTVRTTSARANIISAARPKTISAAPTASTNI